MSDEKKVFVTAINCMDGRVQLPVIEWLRREYKADYVDMITEAGPNKLLAENRFGMQTSFVKAKVEISVKKHGSNLVAVIGHHDCAGNPTDKEKQVQHIKTAIETIMSWGLNVKVIGLWVDDYWMVHKIK